MWVKATYYNLSLSSFNKKLLFTMVLYWCNLIPVCQLLPAEGYNLLLVLQTPYKGATTPFALVLADVLVRRYSLTKGYNLLFSSRDHVS